MTSSLLSLRLFVGLAIAVATAAAAAAPPPIEAFFQKPTAYQVTLSPDGRAVAMLVNNKDQRTRLAVVDLDTFTASVVGASTNRDVTDATWVNDMRLVFSLSYELIRAGVAETGPGLFAVNRDGTNFRWLVRTTPPALGVMPADRAGTQLHSETYLVATLAAAAGTSPSADVFVARPEEVSREKLDYFQLRRLDTQTGRFVEIDAPRRSYDWLFDDQGRIRAAFTKGQGRGALWLRQPDGQLKQVDEFDGLEGGVTTPLWVGPDQRLYGVATPNNTKAVFELDSSTGKPVGTALASNPGFDVEPTFIANDRKLLGIRYTVDAEVTQWLDADMQALQQRIDKLLPSTANRLSVATHGDSPWVLVQARADVQPTVSYAFNRSTGKFAQLSTALPGIDAKQMAQTDFVRVPARDGLPLPVYITLPQGTPPANKWPMVVLVHGGPWVRGANWVFDAEVQFLASRGYAVLQPEFRGSTGFGRKHFEASFKQWGRAMQDDLADATRWAITQGHADPQRICIAGASYGGYAALMGLVRDPDLYRCGINWVGVTDPQLLFSSVWSDIRGEAKKYSLNRMIGDPETDAALLKSVSPLANAARIKRPLLMAYGAWDARVPLVHGERLRDALRPHNSAVEWVVYDKEGHGWDKPETRFNFWGRVERFLAQHIGAP
jgi:dipeptidyl aminopeptidase/acylaminoacyl peptidase